MPANERMKTIGESPEKIQGDEYKYRTMMAVDQNETNQYWRDGNPEKLLKTVDSSEQLMKYANDEKGLANKHGDSIYLTFSQADTYNEIELQKQNLKMYEISNSALTSPNTDILSPKGNLFINYEMPTSKNKELYQNQQ